MINLRELWEYFESVKGPETFQKKGCVSRCRLLFTSKHKGCWYDLFLLTFVYLILKTRLSFHIAKFKFTINVIIDACDISIDPLTEKDLNDFHIQGKHPRLMQVTVGPSIGGDYWYDELRNRIALLVERYESTIFVGLGITLYGVSAKIEMDIPSMEAMKNGVWEILSKPESVDIGIGIKDALLSDNSGVLISPPKPKVSEVVRFSPGSYIASCKPDRGKSTFISADIETICIDNVHVPYAMGYVFMSSNEPVTYCTESPYYTGSFVERSRSMFYDFFSGLLSYSASYRTKKIYFHNLSRFDGILLLKYLIEDSRFLTKPLIREHHVYQILIYSSSNPKKMLLDIRDSLKLLPGSLKSLADTMCPELGGKGSIPHEELNESNISEKMVELINYLKQDILLLAGVLNKAQGKYWDRYNIDITRCLTVSSMAMKIYRTHYYPRTYPIYRPSPNKASFIRRGYFGGHTDVYIPHGKDLFYYDVNSLYPFAMTKPMPGGIPVWNGKLNLFLIRDRFLVVHDYALFY